MTKERGEIYLLVKELARLLADRSSTPRHEALGLAYRAIEAYAVKYGLPDEFCDKVLLLFLSSKHDILEAA